MKTILNEREIKQIIKTLAEKIVVKYKDMKNTALIGIHTNGVFIAERLNEEIKNLTKKSLPIGTLDITFYRDDIGISSKIQYAKETRIGFDINNKDIILADDVLYTGRTIRAAMEQVLEIGRPKTISVVVLIDRGLRELPVYAEFIGKKIVTTHQQQIELFIKELGKKDRVILYDKKNR